MKQGPRKPLSRMLRAHVLASARPARRRLLRVWGFRGFTLVEVMIVAAILATLAALAVPSYFTLRTKAQVAAAITDLKNIEAALYAFSSENGLFPATLAAVRLDNLRDPWGSPYDYWPITGDPKQKVRKDRNLHPINTDFDLCSWGRDGKTNYPLTAKASQDDVLRANNGAFFGLAANY